jgi:hypothetical protein
MSNLYQDAILDAKALRASAMANAKAALEEAFEPKIQEMIRLKLSEEAEELEEVEEVEEAIEEKMHDDKVEETYSEDGMEENLDINEQELEEILAQLEELTKADEVKHSEMDEASHEEMEEAKHDDMKEADHKEMDEAKHEEMEESLNEAEEEEEKEEEEGEEEEEAGEEEVVDDETKVIDITLGDLKQVLQSVMAGQQDLGLAGDEADADSEAEAEISLDEILAELEKEGMEDAAHRDPGYAAGKQHPEIEEEGLEEKKEDDEKKEKVEEELEEAKATIEQLRQDLQEVNLLNAKYLYMNKLFKSKSLTESQKVKVINALDRASSVAEVKNTYETLKESFEAKTQLKESIGFASQAAGIAPKQPIIEQDNMMNRWQKLAGIK